MKHALPFSLLILAAIVTGSSFGQHKSFAVIAFYTARQDAAHISFVKEANTWFSKTGAAHNFEYDSTSDWNNLNERFLSRYQVVIFLDTRPDSAEHRKAFEQYMKNGGAWMGFHFAAFALTPSAYPQNWEWYHDEFLGSGQYASNTWRPTSAILKVEDKHHPVLRSMPSTFASSPNEWYRWKNDLRKNKYIRVLVSIHPKSFPLGTGPKPHEIWHSGDYPVVWTNTKYRMIYFNMGHNDIDYDSGSGRELSLTFENDVQNKLILAALFWLARR